MEQRDWALVGGGVQKLELAVNSRCSLSKLNDGLSLPNG